jgi:hypothetical protein
MAAELSLDAAQSAVYHLLGAPGIASLTAACLTTDGRLISASFRSWSRTAVRPGGGCCSRWQPSCTAAGGGLAQRAPRGTGRRRPGPCAVTRSLWSSGAKLRSRDSPTISGYAPPSLTSSARLREERIARCHPGRARPPRGRMRWAAVDAGKSRRSGAVGRGRRRPAGQSAAASKKGRLRPLAVPRVYGRSVQPQRSSGRGRAPFEREWYLREWRPLARRSLLPWRRQGSPDARSRRFRRAYATGALIAYRRRGSRAVLLDDQDVLAWARGELLQPTARTMPNLDSEPVRPSARNGSNRVDERARAPRLGSQQRLDLSADALHERRSAKTDCLR